VSAKSKPKMLEYNFKVVNKFPSNLAHGICDQCLTVRHINYPLHLMYVSTLVHKVMRVTIVTKHGIISIM